MFMGDNLSTLSGKINISLSARALNIRSMKSTLFQRLLEVCRDQGIDSPRNRDIQQITGLSSGRITQIKNEGASASLGADAQARLVQKGYSPLWISDGRTPKRLLPSSDRQGGMPAAKSPQLIDMTEHPDLVPIKRVRFKLAAGVHGYAIEVDNGDSAPVFFRRDWMTRNGYLAEKLAAFRVCGASMEPSLWADDLVVVNLADTQPSDGDVFAVSYEGEPGIKRMRRDAGEWWLVSDNTDQRRFAPKRCHEDTQIIGRVIYKQSERI